MNLIYMNTIYYLKEDQELTDVNDEAPSCLYNDLDDVMNYAVIFVYENGEEEKVLRTPSSTSHVLILKKLFLKSKKLKKLQLEKQLNELEHIRADIILTKKNIMSLYYYCSTPEYHNMHIGYLNVPLYLTDKQKWFLKDRLGYFEQYDFLTINQYIKDTQELKDLTEQDQNFMRVLRNLIQK